MRKTQPKKTYSGLKLYKHFISTQSEPDKWKIVLSQLKNDAENQFKQDPVQIYDLILKGMTNFVPANPFNNGNIGPSMFGIGQGGGNIRKYKRTMTGGDLVFRALHPGLTNNTKNEFEVHTKPSSSESFTEVFNSISNGFTQIGLKMNSKDRAAVNRTIKHINELEDHLGKLLSLLKVFSNLGRQFNIDPSRIDRENITEMPSMLDTNYKSRKEYQQYIINHIKKVTGTIDANVHTQNRYGRGMIDKVFPMLINRLISELEDKSGATQQGNNTGSVSLSSDNPYKDFTAITDSTFP